MREQNADQRTKYEYLNYLLLLLVLLLVVAVRIRLLDVPLERDEGEYAYMGQLLLKGIPPFANAYTMKLPGVSAVYAAYMSFFGQTTTGIHLGLLVTNLISAAFLWQLARRLFRRNTATVATAIYLMLSLSQGVLGVFAHATHYVTLFALIGFSLLLQFLEKRRMPLLAISGLCFGLAVTMKQHAASLVIFAFLYLLWKSYKQAAPAKRMLSTATLFLATAAAPFLFIAAWLAKAGVFKHFWFWTVQYARDYTDIVPLADAFSSLKSQVDIVASPELMLWVAALLGAVLLLVWRKVEADRVFIFGFLFSAFLAICPGFYFREHYFVLMLPAIAMLAGVAVTEIAAQVSPASNGLRHSVQIAILAAIIGYGVYHERLYLFTFSPVEVCRSTYGVNPFPESIAVARYLQEHTKPNDRVAVLGSEPQIYFYADRVSATGHIYLFPLMENQPHAVNMQEEMIREIEAAQPAYLVVLSDVYWDMKQQSSMKLRDWADHYIRDKKYQLAGVTNITRSATTYFWNNDVSLWDGASNLYITVWKRPAS